MFSKQSKQLADEQIVSPIDFVSNVLEISKSCVYSKWCLELRYYVLICRFRVGILSIPNNTLPHCFVVQWKLNK